MLYTCYDCEMPQIVQFFNGQLATRLILSAIPNDRMQGCNGTCCQLRIARQMCGFLRPCLSEHFAPNRIFMKAHLPAVPLFDGYSKFGHYACHAVGRLQRVTSCKGTLPHCSKVAYSYLRQSRQYLSYKVGGPASPCLSHGVGHHTSAKRIWALTV